LTLLKDVGLIPVLISGYWMPPLEELFERHRKQLLGFDTIVLRLMGEDRGKIEETTGKVWNRIVEPHDANPGEHLACRPDSVPVRQQPLRGVRTPDDHPAPRPSGSGDRCREPGVGAATPSGSLLARGDRSA